MQVVQKSGEANNFNKGDGEFWDIFRWNTSVGGRVQAGTDNGRTF